MGDSLNFGQFSLWANDQSMVVDMPCGCAGTFPRKEFRVQVLVSLTPSSQTERYLLRLICEQVKSSSWMREANTAEASKYKLVCWPLILNIRMKMRGHKADSFEWLLLAWFCAVKLEGWLWILGSFPYEPMTNLWWWICLVATQHIPWEVVWNTSVGRSSSI